MNGDSRPYFHDLSLREDWDVVGRQRVLAGAERVAELAEIHELSRLRLADDELRAALDGLVVVREPVRERVAGIVGPLDDLEQLALQKVHDAHCCLRPKVAAVRIRLKPDPTYTV